MEKILWTKEYQEDVGPPNESRHAEYGYYYHIYWFQLPDKQRIKARRYTDTPDLCSLFFALDDVEKRKDPESVRTKEYMYAIVDFLIQKEGLKKVDYFSQGYKPVDLTKIKKLAKNTTFEKLK